MPRYLLLLCVVLLALPLAAQADPTPYERALQLIEEARVSGATALYLAGVGLTELPPELWQLRHLEYLYLMDNQLTGLPPEIGELTNLEELYLQNNRLTHLPAEIGQLTRLYSLDVALNQLSTLPPEIGQLTFLCYLNIQKNQFQHLPYELSQLTHLAAPPTRCDDGRALLISNNPLITPPPEVIAQGTSAIQAYLREQAEYHTRQLLLSAAGGVGILASVVLFARWRYRHSRKPKKKNEVKS